MKSARSEKMLWIPEQLGPLDQCALQVEAAIRQAGIDAGEKVADNLARSPDVAAPNRAAQFDCCRVRQTGSGLTKG